jgi:hypothetical protein
MRVKTRCILIGAPYYFAATLVLVALNGGIETPSPRWEKTNAAALEQGVAIAVCHQRMRSSASASAAAIPTASI